MTESAACSSRKLPIGRTLAKLFLRSDSQKEMCVVRLLYLISSVLRTKKKPYIHSNFSFQFKSTMPSQNFTSSLVTYIESSFGALDYAVLAVFLFVSGSIGVFFSSRGQNKTTGLYFFGDRRMGAVPVGISTGVSFMSAVSIVGYPAEIFNNGWGFAIAPVTGAVTTFMMIMFVAKIIHPLKIGSLNEYFEKRFQSKALSSIANIMILIAIMHYMGACMYAAILALNSVTGGDVSIVLALVVACTVGVFYTSIGGLKAVIWADVLQFGVMLTGVIAVVVKSILDSPEGMKSILQTNKEFNRLDIPSLSPDPTIRHSMWGLTVGAFFLYASYSTNPVMIQRINSLDSLSDCVIIAAITSVIYLIFTLLPVWAGLNIFSFYTEKGCNVLSAGWIEKNDIIMYYIRDRLSFPGFQGFFMAALFAGSLSSLSSGLNSASSIIWNDFLLPYHKEEPSQLRATLISKIVVVIFGALSMIWTSCLLSFSGLLLQVLISTEAAISGAYFSLFAFALFFPFGNWKGGIAGTIVSFAITMYLGIGSVFFGKSQTTSLPTTTENCEIVSNVTRLLTSTPDIMNNTTEAQKALRLIHSMSYLWLAALSIFIFFLVAACVSTCTRDKNAVPTDPKLLCCVCRGGCNGSHTENENCQIDAPTETLS